MSTVSFLVHLGSGILCQEIAFLQVCISQTALGLIGIFLLWVLSYQLSDILFVFAFFFS